MLFVSLGRNIKSSALPLTHGASCGTTAATKKPKGSGAAMRGHPSSNPFFVRALQHFDASDGAAHQETKGRFECVVREETSCDTSF
jgi:hypothetical protein